MAWLSLNARLYLGVSAHVQLHALSCFGDSTKPPPEETALGRVSHLNGSFKPLAPAAWHGTTSTRHQQEWAKRQSRQHSAELQDRNSAGRLQLISLGNRDGFGSMAGETSHFPGHLPKHRRQETTRTAHAIYANKVDTDEDAAQGLRRLGQQARLYGP